MLKQLNKVYRVLTKFITLGKFLEVTATLSI